MYRLIVPFPPPGRATAASESVADKVVGRLIKYIPAEIISTYALLSGIVDGASRASPLRELAAWGIFGLGVVLTPIYFWQAYQPRGVQRWQLLISTISFVFWAYALGGPFTMGPPLLGQYAYEGWFATLSAGAFSWAVAWAWKPVEKPPKEEEQPPQEGKDDKKEPPASPPEPPPVAR
jgi:hypothetical protein